MVDHPEFLYLREAPQRCEINIGNDVWMGHGCKILNGITIGDGAIIGAFTILRRDVPPYAVMIGNPEYLIRYRCSPDQIAALLRIKWWDWPVEIVMARAEDFRHIETFIQKYDIPC
jgi:acetyltransferase-like isoleucine patch superfamily enzyme